MTKILLIVLSLALLAPNFADVNINGESTYQQAERYDPQLSYITGLQKLEQHTDSIAAQKNILQGSPEYYVLLEYIISQRFFHGFSHYTLKENWLAAAGEKIAGNGLACKVVPEEILKHPEAACSQQAIVMMAIASRKKVDYRSIGFPHHYTLELKIQGKWYYFDPDMEPDISAEERSGLSWQSMGASLKKHYASVHYHDFESKFGAASSPIAGTVNADPAPRVEFFHGFTSVLSKMLWLFPLMMAMMMSWKEYRAAVPSLRSYKMNNGRAVLLPA